MLFLDTLNAELFGCYTVSWHPVAVCVCVCVNGPEASIGSGSLPHRCLLNGQIHTQLTWFGSSARSWSLLHSPPTHTHTPPRFSSCLLSLCSPRSCRPLFHLRLFSFILPFFFFGIVPFSLLLSFRCQPSPQKELAITGVVKTCCQLSNIHICTVTRVPICSKASRFHFPIQTNPKQLHI